jgi:hypothetical protein
MGRRRGERVDRQSWQPKDGSGHGVVEFRGSEEECRRAREYLEKMREEEGIGGGFTMSSWQTSANDYGYGYGGSSGHGHRHGRSRGEGSPKHKEEEVPAKREKVRYDDADTAFILGRGGKTKQKIIRVSGAQLELHERNNVVDIYGSDEAVRKARKYIDLVRIAKSRTSACGRNAR